MDSSLQIWQVCKMMNAREKELLKLWGNQKRYAWYKARVMEVMEWNDDG